MGKSRMINIAIDFGSSKQIFNGTLEFYTKKGINLIGLLH